MRIAQLGLAGRGAWPDLHIERLNPQLNVFYGKPGSGKSTLAQLVNHLLYGKVQSPWRQQFGQSVPLTAGQLTVENTRGSFVLRRHLEPDRTSRLTVAAVDGQHVDGRTVQSLLSDLSPQVLSQLMAVDFAESPSVDWLLGKDFTIELAKIRDRNLATASHVGDSDSDSVEPPDRQRIDELIRQRDAINESLEKNLGMRRQEANVLTAELAHLEGQLGEDRQKLEAVLTDLRRVEAEIVECKKRLRYFSLTGAATKQVTERDSQRMQRELAELEAEISRCRKSLSDLQDREATLRAELAQVAPDGTASRVGFLTDSRGTLEVLEKLLNDLDAEVSLVARAAEPGRAIDTHCHARLSPVAAMLRQQVYTLCGLVTEQERDARRQQLTTESRQISRSQLDVGERLEHLLSRRETLIHQLSTSSQRVPLTLQPPVTEHCRCEHHAHFVAQADPLLTSRSARESQTDLTNRYEALLRQQCELQARADDLQQQLAANEAQWKEVQRQRAGLVGNQNVEEHRHELERLEIAIREALKPGRKTDADQREVWRASDVLAQLTNGRLIQIRLGRDGRNPIVIDDQGRATKLNSLSTAAHDQLYLSLSLALVASFARRGVNLPLVLDEPFLRQDTAGSATMAGVLAEFARSGHQVLVFTEDMDALRHFKSLSSTVFDLAELRKPRAPEVISRPVGIDTTLTRLVRETSDGHRLPVLQMADGANSAEPQFYLAEDSSLAQFPVLGSGTAGAFSKIDIHTVGQLLAADAATVSKQLNRKHVTADTVGLWQAHMRLMCSVPGLTLNDAQILTACGVRCFADLRQAVPIELETSIREFLRGDRGQRFADSLGRFNASQIREWVHMGTHRSTPLKAATTSRPTTKTTLRAHRPPREVPQFYLDRASHVANAPSIGPRTAQVLASVGIRTVADLLNANSASIAANIGLSHITAETIDQWQTQARLVCQIPDLRGYSAQLLVACGFTSPEEIADTKPAELIRRIQAFCESKQGERILRNHEAPTPAKIKRWARNAAHRRPLEAA